MAVLATLASCSSVSPPTGEVCIAGEVWSCDCGELRNAGRRRCRADGTFDVCDCRAPSTARPKAPTAGTSGAAQQRDANRTSEPSGASTGTAGRAARPDAAPGVGQPAAGSGEPLAPGAPSAGSSSSDMPLPELTTEPEDDSAYIFDQSALRTYDLLIAPADLANINRQPSLETWVPARLDFEGKVYGPLMVRYKGSAGSFKAPCTTNGPEDPKDGKCSIKIGFDEVNEEERFFGLKKLNLHAMIQDPSLMHDRLGYSLFREHGVAAPRAVHAQVLINGELEGVFIAVEQVDGRFTRARFGEGGEGNVYKEAWVTMDSEADYLESLETNKREQPSVKRMLEFQNAVRTRGALTSFFDRDYMLRYFAVDRVIINDDGVLHFYCDVASPNYPGTSHNFYWYESKAGDRFWLIPWDLDLAFDATPFVHVSPAWFAPASCTCVKDAKYGSQFPASCDPLVQRFIGWRNDFDAEVDRFLKGAFAPERVEQKLRAWSAQIRPAVVEAAGVKNAPTEREWNTALDELRLKIDAARRNRGYAYP